jgi:hypothetical protein
MTSGTLRVLGRAVTMMAMTVALAGAAGAVTLTGVVRNEAGVGIGNVDLDLLDLCSGDNVFLVGDKTAADGSFSLVVNPGTYDLHATPPAAATVCAGDLQDLTVTVNASLGVITLHPGARVSGTVRTASLSPAAGVDLKFVDRATDHRVFLTKSVTNASGQWSVRVPPGTWDIDFRPAAGALDADAERLGLVVGATDVSGLIDDLRAGFTITGTVRDRNNNRIKNVDLDVFDECSGHRVPTAHDNTNANGDYSIVLPAGTYTFSFDPPACASLAAARTTGVIVDRSRNHGTEQLDAAVVVSGLVRAPGGAPLPGARLRFYDVTKVGAPRQATTRDRTGADGTFAVQVPVGTYDVNVEPPVGASALVEHVNNLSVLGSMAIGDLTLTAGLTVHGHLTRPGGAAAGHVNVNAVESTTRAAQRLADDATDDAGDFTVVLPPGQYDFQYDPAGCSGLAPEAQEAVTVAGPTTLPALALVTGATVTGTVLDSGALPVAGVDLDVYDAGTTHKRYTPNDQTAAAGTYSVVVPPGTYDVKWIPSSLTRLRPAALGAQPVAGATTLPTQVLPDGWHVTGLVRDSLTALPLAGVTVDVYPSGGGTALWTPHHLSDLTGAYDVVVDAGSWDLLYTPPAGSPLAPLWVRGVAVGADTPRPDVRLSPPVASVAPRARALALDAYPNPARQRLSLAFRAPGGDAELTVWDLAGRRVATPWRGRAEGAIALRWEAVGADGAPLPAGVYLVRLAARDGASRVRRVVLVP